MFWVTWWGIQIKGILIKSNAKLLVWEQWIQATLKSKSNYILKMLTDKDMRLQYKITV